MTSARRILVLHGPNLNLLPGARSLEAIDATLKARATALGVELKTFQSNWEGALLDTLAAERNWFEAVIINPATLAPSAVGLAEALKLLKKPAIEVQLDDSQKKGKSALKEVVEKQISGKGPEGYLEALVALAPKGGPKGLEAISALAAKGRTSEPSRNLGARVIAATVADARAGKTPVRGATVKSIGREPPPDKNIGRVLPNGEIVKSLGNGRQRVLSKKLLPPPPSAPTLKSMGSRPPSAASSSGVLTRAVVRQQIADRLSGVLTPATLSAWARAQWQKLQSGAPMESGQREVLEDVLQQLLLSSSVRTSDDQLIELMTQLA